MWKYACLLPLNRPVQMLMRAPLQCCPSPSTAQRSLCPVDAFWQVQGRGQIAPLFRRQGHRYHRVGPRIVLVQQNGAFCRMNGDIFLQRRSAFIHKGDNGRVELMFNCKHTQNFKCSDRYFKDHKACVRSGDRPDKCYIVMRWWAWKGNQTMVRNRILIGICVVLLAGCETTVEQTRTAPSVSAQQSPGQRVMPQKVARNFVQVVQTVEPVAERECRNRTRQVNCDFRIVVDDRPDQPANAFQTLDRNGRPIIAFTIALIEDARNQDELAFVMGHEAAHHIAGHIDRQQQNAVAGAVIAGSLAVLLGSDPAAVELAQQQGAQVGARTYSKDFELEADALGTVIAARAGYDPVRGAEFFNRIPDPGNRFLGTHPPNAQRIATVRRVAAGL